MTTKWKKRGVWTAGVFLVLLVAAWCLWLPIMTAIVVNHGARFFRNNFHSRRDFHALIHEDDWVLSYFAGTQGLPKIKSLSADTSLIPSGRQVASNLYTHVSAGGHIPGLRWNLQRSDLPWLRRRYYTYILKQDTKYLRSKGLPVPEGTIQ